MLLKGARRRATDHHRSGGRLRLAGKSELAVILFLHSLLSVTLTLLPPPLFYSTATLIIVNRVSRGGRAVLWK